MASSAVFSSLRRQRTPSLEALLVPVEFSDAALLDTLTAVLCEVISTSSSNRTPPFQRKNSRSLVRKMEVFAVVVDCLVDSSSRISSKLPSTEILCFKELYLVLYRSKILLDYCMQSSKLWLLLQNHAISGHFHDLNQDISTLLYVFPLDKWNLPQDVVEQVQLLKKQSQKSKLYIDRNDEMLRLKLYSFLSELEFGCIPDQVELRSFFLDNLGIRDAATCRMEIEFLEEQILNHNGDMEPTAPVLDGIVALMRYCRFLLFGFDVDEIEKRMRKHSKLKKGLISQEIAETFISVPKDFCCPISWDLMKDPVIVSTGKPMIRVQCLGGWRKGIVLVQKQGKCLFMQSWSQTRHFGI